MIVEIYILLSIFAFIFFYLSFRQEPKVFFSALSMVLFFALAIAAGDIEKVFCFEVNNAAECTASSSNDMGVMITYFLFAVLNLIYLLSYAFGYSIQTADKIGR